MFASSFDGGSFGVKKAVTDAVRAGAKDLVCFMTFIWCLSPSPLSPLNLYLVYVMNWPMGCNELANGLR